MAADPVADVLLRSLARDRARAMTVGSTPMRFANPAGLALLALAMPVLLAHVLRPRRTPVTVSSILLWQRVERPVSAAQPWQRLRWSLLLLAQLLAVVLLAAGRRPAGAPRGVAARRAHRVHRRRLRLDGRRPTAPPTGSPTPGAAPTTSRDELPTGGVASIVVAGDDGPGRPHRQRRRRRVRAGAAHDRPVTEGRADVRRRLRPGREPRDRHHADRLRARSPTAGSRRGGRPAAGRHPRRAGRPRTPPTGASPGCPSSRAAAASTPGSSVRNHGGPAVTQTVRVDVDGVDGGGRRTSRSAPGEQRDVELDVPDGRPRRGVPRRRRPARRRRPRRRRRRRAAPARRAASSATRCSGSEAAGVDPRRDRRARRHADRRPTATTSSSTTASPCRPSPARRSSPSPRPAALPATPDGAGIAVAGVADDARPSRSSAPTTPCSPASTSSDVAIADGPAASNAGDAEVLVAAEARTAAPARHAARASRFAYLTFDLRDSNLAVQLAFPLLADRLVGELTGTTTITEPLEVGERLPVPARRCRRHRTRRRGAHRRRRRRRRRSPTAAASGRSSAPRRARRRRRRQPAGRRERDRARRRRAPPAPATGDDDAGPPGDVAAALGAVAAARRSSPSRPSSPGAASVSAAGSGALARRRCAPSSPRCSCSPCRSRRCADRPTGWPAVFVVDGSASVGAAGRRRGRGVRRRRASPTARTTPTAGVVVFGADARVDQVHGRHRRLRRVDDRRRRRRPPTSPPACASAPPCCRATPAAASCWSATAGRTTGDVDDGARAAAGERASRSTSSRWTSAAGPDAAVAAVDVPRLARIGERIAVDVHVVAASPDDGAP